MSGIIDGLKQALAAGLADLDADRQKVIGAMAALDGKTIKAKPGRPAGSATKAPKKRARRKGTRREQALALIRENPGIRAADIAKTMKIKPNYLYRVLADLEKENLVTKEGKTYKAKPE